MGESMDGFGLSWEQLLIAGVAFAVLVGVAVAAFRGAGRGRRERREAEAAILRGRPETRPPREVSRLTAAARAEPSLGRVAAPEAPPPEPFEPRPAPEPEPFRAETLRPVLEAAADRASGFAVGELRAELDELRQANAILKRRVEETERTLNDLQTEIQAKFASLERAAARDRIQPAAPSPAPLRPPPPLRFGQDADAAPEKDDNLERARRAIELLSRKDGDAS